LRWLAFCGVPTKAERTALVFVAAVALAGGLVRVARALRGGQRPPPAAVAALADQRRLVDSAARVEGVPRGGRAVFRVQGRPETRKRTGGESVVPTGKLPPGSLPVDVDRATAIELEALPRIGPTLAARIVAEREANGPFGDLDALDRRVKGIGPALAKAIQPLVRFSGQ
jgi:competence protein ComEA